MLSLMLFWGLTIGLLGKILLGTAVILVHSKITHEKRIDGVVLMEMHRERHIAFIGLALMVLGYLMEIAAFGFLDALFAYIA